MQPQLGSCCGLAVLGVKAGASNMERNHTLLFTQPKPCFGSTAAGSCSNCAEQGGCMQAKPGAAKHPEHRAAPLLHARDNAGTKIASIIAHSILLCAPGLLLSAPSQCYCSQYQHWAMGTDKYHTPPACSHHHPAPFYSPKHFVNTQQPQN